MSSRTLVAVYRALVGCASLLMGSADAFADADTFKVGQVVPNFTLKALNPTDAGTELVSLESYLGPEADQPKKAVLISFFATYCEPCKKEMPMLAALQDTYGSKGLQVLLVSIDKEDSKLDEARVLAEKAGVKFPVLADRFNIVAKRYHISQLPCVYVVNDQSKIAMVSVGYTGDITKDLLSNVRNQIGVPQSEATPEALVPFVAGGKANVSSVLSAAKAAPAEDEEVVTPAKAEPEKKSPAPASNRKKKTKKSKK